MKARLILAMAVVVGVALLPTSAAAEEPGVIATVPVGARPQGVDVNPNTNLIYVANRDGHSVSVIDGNTNTVTNTITGVGVPSAVAVDEIRNLIYVADQGPADDPADDRVLVIDGTYHTVVDEIGVGNFPYGADVNPDTNFIYVANYGYSPLGNTVSVIDGVTHDVATVVVGSGPLGVAVNPDTNLIYVANHVGNSVSVIAGAVTDPAEAAVVATIGVGNQPYGVSVNPTTDRVYVAREGGNSVSVRNGAAPFNELATVGVGSGPDGVAVNPTTNRIYVANHASSNVSVIDGVLAETEPANAVVATVPVGAWTLGVAANATTNRIYVTNHYGDTVSVILWCVFDDDADCDGCYDIREPGLPPAADPADAWDFYDVPVPSLYDYIHGHISGDASGEDTRDHAISIINDVLAVLEYSGTSDEGPPNGAGIDYDDDVNEDGIDDGIAYDRFVAVRSGVPDGAVSIIVDVLLVLEQSGQMCEPP